MLIGSFLVISLAVAAGVCAATGSFVTLTWAWLLPATLVGTFLVLAGLWYGMIVIMANAVDMEKEREKDSPFYRAVAMLTINALIPILKVTIRTRGLEQTPKDGRFLLVCNHLSLLDPVMLLAYFRKSQLAFISKRENNSMFLVGKLMHKMLCQLINRENDREALKTIINCIRLIQEDKASIGVFPEGYIHGDEKLHPFRSGVFKIAQKTKVPIVVCTLQNTQKVKKNMPHLKPTDVHLHLVGVVQPEELEGLTTVDVANRVHAMMAQDLGPELVLQENA